MDLQGTQGADTLTGGADSDTIHGYGGADTLKGGAGDDVLAGNDGNDILQGGDGDDYILGGAGADTIDGGTGNDWAAYEDAAAGVKVDLNLTGTQNTVGAGTDKLTSIENVYGSAFNDTLTGNAEANMLVGGAGADTVNGGKGDDTLWGSAGNDTLDGGDGDDYLVGGLGDDVLKGGAGSDWASYEDAAAGGVRVDLALTTAQNTDGGGTDTLSGIENLLGSKANDVLMGDDSVNYLTGGAGTDTLIGRGGDDHFQGDAGDDFIDGGAGFDVVSYDDGIEGGVYVDLRIPIQHEFLSKAHGQDRMISIEALWGSMSGDTFIGNASENYLAGNGGNDTLVAVGGHDTLDGGDGDDLLTSSVDGDGDLLLGGAGDDLLAIGGSQGLITLDGGAGSDTIRFTGAVGVTFDLSKAGPQTAAAGLSVDVQGVENVQGGAGNDHLTGDAGDNVLTGGAGDDVLDGGAGFDLVSYENDGVAVGVSIDMRQAQQNNGHGKDTFVSIEGVRGTSFDDTLYADEGSHLFGAGGNDRLVGRGGGILDGGDGDDVLSATIGGDDMSGGVGNDRLDVSYGAGGKDTAATADGGAGDDIISLTQAGYHIVDGGQGADWLDLTLMPTSSSPLTIDLRVAGWQTVAQDRLYLDVRNIENIRGSNGADHLIGDAKDNVFDGQSGDDVVDGGDGFDIVSYQMSGTVTIDLRQEAQNNAEPNGGGFGAGLDRLISIEGVIGNMSGGDTLIGNDGKNYLRGLGGDDTLKGMGGDDVLIGDDGANTLDGGEGSDTADYSAATQGVTIDLAKAADGLIATGVSNDRLISIENLVGSTFADKLAGDASANALSGGAGDDDLTAIGGGDTLDGGEGNDLLRASASADGDVLIGGKGQDDLWGGAGRNTFKFAIGDSLPGDTGSDVDVIHGFQITDRLTFESSASAWSYGENTAGSYGDALGLAYDRLATGETGRNFTAVAVGADVFVFAGEIDAQGGRLQNVVKLAGVGLDAIEYYDFLGG